MKKISKAVIVGLLALMLTLISGLGISEKELSRSSIKNTSWTNNDTPKALIDASKDGGLWWFPQYETYDPDEYHQGKGFADFLRDIGFNVTELPRNKDFRINLALLVEYDLVIVPSEYYAHAYQEILAYQNYVDMGGRLLILSYWMDPGDINTVAEGFDIEFAGTCRGENWVNNFADHYITWGVSPIYWYWGSALTNYPQEANILAWVSDETYLDLDDDEEQDEDEPTGCPVLGCMDYGMGKIVFYGDVSEYIFSRNQPLLGNTIDWLLSPTVKIDKPTPGVYFRNEQILSLSNKIVIIGDITIQVSASDIVIGDIAKVEFYIDDTLQETDLIPQWEWEWDTAAFLSHDLKVIAYDYAENTAEESIEVLVLKL